MQKMKVVQYGLGPIGNTITKYLVERPRIQLTGAIDIDPKKIGLDVGELAGLPKPLGVKITNDRESVLDKSRVDIVVLTTTSSIEKIQPQIMEIVSNGINVVSTCEELSYPWVTKPQIAGQIDKAAKENNVSVLGTGINPGFLMDFLPATVTGVCRHVKKVKVERIQNAQFRRLPFQKKVGAGLSINQFHAKVKEGTLRHVGLTESMHLIASRLGWTLDKTEDIINPAIAAQKVETKELTVQQGQVLGVNQIGRGYINGKEVITLVFKAAIAEPDPGDHVHIEGTPNINLTIREGVNGDIGTCAIIVNAIPSVINALPGLRTMADIEAISCFGC